MYCVGPRPLKMASISEVEPPLEDLSSQTDFFALPGLPSVGFEEDIPFSGRDSRQMCIFENGEERCIEDNTSRIFLLKRDNWVMPMIGFSAMNVLVILAFEIYVICKATGSSPSRR